MPHQEGRGLGGRRHGAGRHRPALIRILLALTLGLGVPGTAGACPDLFPKLTAAIQLAPDDLLLYLGADNFLNVAVTPVINVFDPNIFSTPPKFEPGFTPVGIAIRLDPTLVPTLKWFLGCQSLVVDTLNIPGDLFLPAPTAGPAGPVGPQGPVGPPGPPGGGNVFPASMVHTFPRGGLATIHDPNVTPTSVILLQYVGGEGNPRELLVQHVEAGLFVARGRVGRQFRYVVFN